MIDIIIPAYNAHKTLRKTLLSIASQDNAKDIKVCIVDDCSKKGYKEEVEIFRRLLDIKEICMPQNSGPGAARQFGLENTDSEYILFMDSDDLFYDNLSLSNLVNGIDGADMSKGGILEEREYEYFDDFEDEYSLHGKLYKRSIINKYDLKFDPFRSKEANAHEDNSFNNLYELCCKKINKVDSLVYVYTFNYNSITKTEVSEVKSMENYIHAMNYLAKEIEKRDIKDRGDIARRFCFILYYSYYTYLASPSDYKFMFEDLSEIKKVYQDNIDYFEYEEQANLFNIFKYPFIPTMTFYDFLKKIK